MAGNGMNISVGIDYSQAQKDAGNINKMLKTLSGQDVIINTKFDGKEIKDADGNVKKITGNLRRAIEDAAKKLNEATGNLFEVFNKNKGKLLDLNIDKDIQPQLNKAVNALKKELKKAEAMDDKDPRKKGLIDGYRNDIAVINEYRKEAVELSNALAKAGLSSVNRGSAQNKLDRNAINEEIKLLQKKQELNRNNVGISDEARLNEEIRLQKQLVSLYERKNATYKSGHSKGVDSKLNDARNALEQLEQQKRLNSEKKKEAKILQDISNAESRRAATSKISNKVSRYREERKEVKALITHHERLLALYQRTNNQAGVASANSKLAQLRSDSTALTNLIAQENAKARAIKQQNSLLNQQGNLFQRLKTYAANYFSIFAIWNFVKNIVNTTKEFERQQVALEGIIGSAAKATQVFGQLKQMALKSPFNIAELTSFTKQLAAYNIAVDELLPTTNKLADLSAGLGVEMSRLILAYGQVNAASVLRGQELRQFTEAGVPLVQKLADKFTALNGTLVTTGEVFDMISKRQVSFDMVSQVLTDMTSEGGEFYKMQENLNNTIYGQIEKLKELWSLALKEIGDGSNNIIMNVIQRLQSVVKKLPALLDGIKVGGFAYIVKQLLQLNFGAISFARNLKKCSGIAMKLKFTMKAMTMMNWWSVAIAGIGLIAAGISNAIRKSKEWEKEVSRINESFAKDTAKLTVGFNKLVNKISTASENTKKFADAVSTLKSNYGDFVNDNIVQALINEARAAKEAGNEYRALAESIKASIEAKKEYERHETLKNTAAEQIMGELKIDRIFNVTRSELAKKRETRKSEISSQEGVTSENLLSAYRDDEQLMKIYRAEEKFRSNDLESAVSQAIAQMTSSNETTIEQFSSRFEEALKTYGFNEVAIEAALGQVDELFGKIEGTDQWKTYLSEVRVISNDATTKIREAFEAVDVELSGERYKSIVGDKKKGNYNPLAIDKEEQRLYIEKYTGLLESLLSPEQFNKLAADKGYQAALEISDEDYGKGKALREAIFEYQKTLVSPQKNGESDEDYEKRKKVEQDVFNTIQNISNAFLEFAGTIGETADGIRSNGAQLRGFEKLNLSSEEKDMLTPYLKVTEENVEQQQKALWSELDKLDEFIKTNENNEQFKERVDDAKRRKDILTVLTDENLYYGKKPENKNSGGQQREAISAEFSDFINSFKNAYSTYKDAIQKGGTEMGLGYVRNDKQFQEMFGQFFNGIGGEQFQKLMNVKIGEKGDTTVGQTIQDKFLSGAEEGILDFESAALAVAKELEDYYNSEEKIKPYRKDYLNAAKELKRWVYSTVAKDNLTAALEEFEEGLKGITNTFENTNKSVETYRKLMEQGTAGDLGGQLGVPKSDVLRPQSARQKDFISSYIAEFNNALGKFKGTTPFTLSANALSSPTEVLKAIGKIDEVQRMNAGNFKSNELGSKSEQLKGMLKQLVDMMHQEMADISGQSVTGDIMTDAIKNIAISRGNAEYVAGTKQIKAESFGLIDANAINTLLNASKEEAQAFFDAFMSKEENQMTLDALEHGIDKDTFLQKFDDEVERLDKILGGIPEHLRIELELKRKDVEDKIDKANVEYGKLGFRDEIKKYREANTWAENRKATLNSTISTNKMNLINAESELDELRPMVNSGDATDEQIARYNELSQKANEYRANIKSANDELKNADLKKQQEQIKALNLMKEKVEKFSSDLTRLQDNFVAVFDAIKSCVDTFGKFYDMANDGENPKWIEDTSAVMGDFIENFKSAIAPILGVVAAITAVITIIIILKSVSTELMIVFIAIIAVAAIIAAVFAAIQQHDRNLEHSIEDLKKQVEEFEDAAERLNSVAERMTGIEKLKTQVDALGQSLSSAGAYAEMARLEEEKKNTDEEKVKEYNKQAFEASEEFKNGMKGMLDELIGATEDWSSAMSDAIRSAFQNGDNAARSFRASIKEMMGDVVQSMLEMAILQPLIEDALQEWTNSDALKQKYTKNVTKTDENGNQVTVPEFDSEGYTEELLSNINDPEKAEDAYNSMQNAGDAYIDAVENLPDFLKDAFKFNSDTSSLSGGISGITEDTARQLEGLSNSQLMQLILINRTLTQYLEAATTSSDNNQYMANVQTHLQQINNNVGLILRSITELRDTPSRPLHVTMV